MSAVNKSQTGAGGIGRAAILLLYVPVCCAVSGGLAVHAGLGIPGRALPTASEVFWHYAIPWPGSIGWNHLPSLAIGVLCLGLLELGIRPVRPIITRLQIRIIVLVIAFFAWIYALFFGFGGFPVPSPGDAVFARAQLGWVRLVYWTVDLYLLAALTFVPAYRAVPMHWIGGRKGRQSSRRDRE